MKFEMFDVRKLNQYKEMNEALKQVCEKWTATQYSHYVFDYPFILSNIKADKGKVLDIGCGTGALPFFLADCGHEILCVDRCDVRHTIEQHPKMKFVHAVIPNTFRLPREKEEFKYIISASAIEHNEYSRIPAIFKFLHKTLKKDGLFVFTSVCNKVGDPKEGNLIFNEAMINDLFKTDIKLDKYDELFVEYKKMFPHNFLPFGMALTRDEVAKVGEIQ